MQQILVVDDNHINTALYQRLISVSSPVLWQLALDTGANAFLLKPVDKKQFSASVVRLMAAERAPSQSHR